MHQTLDGGCTDFSRVLKPKIENGDLMGPNGDLMGTQKLKKVPMGTQVSKWGPMWEQWICIQWWKVEQAAPKTIVSLSLRPGMRCMFTERPASTHALCAARPYIAMAGLRDTKSDATSPSTCSFDAE